MFSVYSNLKCYLKLFFRQTFWENFLRWQWICLFSTYIWVIILPLRSSPAIPIHRGLAFVVMELFQNSTSLWHKQTLWHLAGLHLTHPSPNECKVHGIQSKTTSWCGCDFTTLTVSFPCIHLCCARLLES